MKIIVVCANGKQENTLLMRLYKEGFDVTAVVRGKIVPMQSK